MNEIPSARILGLDLEGPLSPDDSAFDIFRGLVPGGAELFAILSYYDDLVALAEREGYEAGDTLTLILPFLLRYGLTPSDIEENARRSKLVTGADALVANAMTNGYESYIISTSYEPHARVLGDRLGVSADHVVATRVDNSLYEVSIDTDTAAILDEARDVLLDGAYADHTLLHYLDNLFHVRLKGTVGLASLRSYVSPIGGARKLTALDEICRQHDCARASAVFVGDSITDAKVLQGVRAADGLAIAFNGNSHAIQHATVAVGSMSVAAILPLLEAWAAGGLPAAMRLADDGSWADIDADCVWNPGRDQELTNATVARHSVFRDAVRADAAGLS